MKRIDFSYMLSFVLLASENIRFCSFSIWSCRGKTCYVFSCISKIAMSWKNIPPALNIAVIDGCCIHEQMCKVFNSVNPKSFASLHDGIVKSRDFHTSSVMQKSHPLCQIAKGLMAFSAFWLEEVA